MIEDVLGEGSVSASRFSRWFSNPSRSGSRSSSLGSTPHEELERLAGKIASGSGLGCRLELSLIWFILSSLVRGPLKGFWILKKPFNLCPFNTVEDIFLCFIGTN